MYIQEGRNTRNDVGKIHKYIVQVLKCCVTSSLHINNLNIYILYYKIKVLTFFVCFVTIVIKAYDQTPMETSILPSSACFWASSSFAFLIRMAECNRGIPNARVFPLPYNNNANYKPNFVRLFVISSTFEFIWSNFFGV